MIKKNSIRTEVVIVIVTFKSAKLTIDCLQSIERERIAPDLHIRVVVVDNASGDAVLIAHAICLHEWSWVTLIKAPRNGGFAYGNNIGFRFALDCYRPDYIHMLNPDTLVKEGAITALVHFLDKHPNVGIAGSSVQDVISGSPMVFRFPTLWSEVDNGIQCGIVTRLLQPWCVAKRANQTPQRTDWLCGASIMIRPIVLDTVNGLDEKYFLYFEETDFCFRAQKAGFSTWHVPDSEVIHLAGQSTKVTNQKSAPTRLPGYWFESRKRFFVVSYGMRYAMAADGAALCSYVLGYIKKILLGRTGQAVPFFIRDLARHSVLIPQNRKALATATSIA